MAELEQSTVDRMNETWREEFEPSDQSKAAFVSVVNGEGSAVIESVHPRSSTVAKAVMPVEHVALDIVPTPIWLERYMASYL